MNHKFKINGQIYQNDWPKIRVKLLGKIKGEILSNVFRSIVLEPQKLQNYLGYFQQYFLAYKVLLGVLEYTNVQ